MAFCPKAGSSGYQDAALRLPGGAVALYNREPSREIVDLQADECSGIAGGQRAGLSRMAIPYQTHLVRWRGSGP